MSNLIILIGNIGSGKSTLAKKYVKEGYRVISRDAIRYMVGAGSYIFSLDIEPTIAKGTLALYEEFLKSGVDIVYDEVNVNKILRKPLIELGKKYNYTIIAHELPRLSQNLCIERRLNDPHGTQSKIVWKQVWEKFDFLYESPTKEEGFDWIK